MPSTDPRLVVSYTDPPVHSFIISLRTVEPTGSSFQTAFQMVMRLSRLMIFCILCFMYSCILHGEIFCPTGLSRTEQCLNNQRNFILYENAFFCNFVFPRDSVQPAAVKSAVRSFPEQPLGSGCTVNALSMHNTKKHMNKKCKNTTFDDTQNEMLSFPEQATLYCELCIEYSHRSHSVGTVNAQSPLLALVRHQHSNNGPYMEVNAQYRQSKQPLYGRSMIQVRNGVACYMQEGAPQNQPKSNFKVDEREVDREQSGFPTYLLMEVGWGLCIRGT